MQFLSMTLETSTSNGSHDHVLPNPFTGLLEMVLHSKYANKISNSNGTTSAINVQEVSPEAILMTIQYLMLIKVLISPSINQPKC